MIRNILVALAVALFAIPMAAQLGTPFCAKNTTCVTDGATRVNLERTNSGSVSNAYVMIPTGTTDDTGTEVAALLSLTCVDVIVLDEGASGTADGGEITAGTCATDVADGGLAILFAK